MTNSITYGGTTLALSDDLAWPDEFGWQPVQQSTERSISGNLIVDVATNVGGRQITLQGDAGFGWMTRSDVAQLDAWRAIPGAQMTLSFRGVTRTVIYDHERTALECTPIDDYSDPSPTDHCVVTLRLIDIG